MWRRSVGCLVVALAVLAAAEAHVIKKWPVDHQQDQNSPEVLQLLRKTANAFKQVGDIILRKTGDAPSSSPSCPQHAVPYGAYPAPQPLVYYPMPYPGAAGVQPVPQVYHPYLPYGHPPAASYHAPAPLPAPAAAPAAASAAAPAAAPQAGYPAELSEQLSSLADEYHAAARKECSCGNVEVNMRPGPSSLAPGSSSDIVVEVTLGDLTQTDAGEESGEESEQKKTVNILNVSEASEGGEVDADTYTKTSSSATIEERTVEETDETNTIQVVEAIRLQPETSPLQVETYDNTVAAIEDTIKKTVVIKSETEETKTIHNTNGETVINTKTYEESFPKAPEVDQEISQGGYEEEVVDQVNYDTQQQQYSQNNYGAQQSQSSQNNHGAQQTQSSQNNYGAQQTQSSQINYGAQQTQSSQSSQSYQEKVEVVEVQEQKLEELKKEANVVSEMVETVDIEEDVVAPAPEAQSTANKDVSIKVVNVGSSDKKQQSSEHTDAGAYYEYEYEYEDVPEDCVDKDAKDLQQYFAASTPKYASPAKEDGCSAGEHVLAEHPHPVENVQVVVKGTNGQAYAEGLQTHASSSSGHNSYSSNSAPACQHQSHGALHHHHAVAKKTVIPYEVPCEAHYGLPRRQQQKPAEAQHTTVYTKKTETYSAPPQPALPAVQTYAAAKQGYSAYSAAQQSSYAAPQQPAKTQYSTTYAKKTETYSAPPQPALPAISTYAVPTPAPTSTPKPQPAQSKSASAVYASVQPESYTRPQQQQHSHSVHSKQATFTQYQPAQSSHYSASQSYSAPQQELYLQQQSSAQQPSYAQPQKSRSQPQGYSKATLYSQSTSYNQPPQSYAAAPVVQQTASWSLPSQQQSYASTSKQTTTVTKQQQQQPSYTGASVQQQPRYPASNQNGYSNYVYSSSNQQQRARPQQTATVVKSQQVSQPPYTAAQSSPPASYGSSPASQARTIAQQAVLGAYHQAVNKQKTDKITPAQYPAYYFTAHSDSIYAPPLLKSQPAKPQVPVAKSQAPAYKGSAPVQAIKAYPVSTEDSAEIVPERYSNSIGAPVENYSSVAYKPAAVKTPAKVVSAAAQSYSAPVEDSAEAASYSGQVVYNQPSVTKVVMAPALSQQVVYNKPSVTKVAMAPALSYSTPVEESAEVAPARFASHKLYAKPAATAAAAAAAYSLEGGSSVSHKGDSAGPTRIDLLPVDGASSSSFEFPAKGDEHFFELSAGGLSSDNDAAIEASSGSAWNAPTLDTKAEAEAAW